MEADPLIARLRTAGSVYAEAEAALLRGDALDEVELEEWTARRVAGEPLEVIVGWAAFRGLRLRVAPGVFVPRARTGAVVERAVALLPEGSREVVVDLCCGVGAIGAAVQAERPEVELICADIDPTALECARENAPGAIVVEGDLFEALPTGILGRVSVLAANAPYVPSDDIPLMPREARLHEHRVALDGGVDGLAVHRRILQGAATWLAPGGHVLIETSRGQADELLAAAEAAGLRARITRDEELDGTVMIARLP
ncbi:putative protein N(5)-glutamine methyltransferase [Homoserinibacter sp. YIM 151385]|uniref:putative protein N(5)-glutamine methyltransferase n=1 Tax=Homoserinibacter sp. YIM 151385 TaxID=2985506 RepID=UPI0022F0646F|nr:putative protein N(5)-glutamine methyltransferase [Homoserinibacter sp. YIM 151385]WBU38038.1 putative protein N(5)-glutamine methyltransferase [Homoserinibacter sp. YIM 151385]